MDVLGDLSTVNGIDEASFSDRRRTGFTKRLMQVLDEVKKGTMTVPEAVEHIKKLTVFNPLEVARLLLIDGASMKLETLQGMGYDVRDVFQYASFEGVQISLE